MASASFDGTVCTWSMRDGTLKVLVKKGHYPSRCFYSVAFSPDGMYVTAEGDDGLLGIWDVKTGQHVTLLEGHCDSVMGVSFLPDRKGLVSASWDHMLKYWDRFVAGGTAIAFDDRRQNQPEGW